MEENSNVQIWKQSRKNFLSSRLYWVIQSWNLKATNFVEVFQENSEAW